MYHLSSGQNHTPMKRSWIIVSVLLLTLAANASPSPSRIQHYIRVWGFLKYYHPAIATGAAEPDSVFLFHLDKVNACNNTKEYQSVIAGMIASLDAKSAVPVLTTKDTVTLFLKNDRTANLFSSNLLSIQTRSYLKKLRKAGMQATQHLYMPENFHATELPAEKLYKQLQFPNVPYQLLALARYWNAVEYLYPYKYILKRDWNTVLTASIPAFMQPISQADYERQLMRLNALIDDSHGEIVTIKNGTEVYGRYFPPFTFRFVGDSIVVKDYIDTLACQQQDIHPGDVITKVRNRSVPQLVNDYYYYTSASNVPKKKTQLASLRLLLPFRGNDSVINISLVRNGKAVNRKLQLQIPGETFRGNLVALYQKENRYGTTQNDFVLRSVDTGIAWVDAVNLSVLYNTTEDDRAIDSVMRLMLTHKKAILLDLRCYGTMAVFFNKLLPALGRPLQPFATLRPHYNKFPGVYYDFDAFSVSAAPVTSSLYEGKLILLVNERTHSQSELITMLMQDSGLSVTVGVQTSGADGDMIYLPVPGGYTLSFSGRHVAYPDGRPSQQAGVKIDKKVIITTKAVAAGRDEILETALGLLQ